MRSITLPAEFPFDDPTLPVQIVPLKVEDIDQIMPIEQVAFSTAWPASAYRYELTKNELCTYLALQDRHPVDTSQNHELLKFVKQRVKPRQAIHAYGGFWMMVDEAHISTIAVHPDWRGRKLGEMMLSALIQAAQMQNAILVSLEVRISNMVAQNLYRKYGFEVVGKRKRYYHDNNEDALIMTTPLLNSESLVAHYADLKTRLIQHVHKELLAAAQPT